MSATASLIHGEFGAACNLYEVLGVAKDADGKAITRAYRKLALRYHPDKHQNDDDEAKAKATAKFHAVSAIHAILSDASSRALYDETGKISGADDDDPFDTASYDMWLAYFAKIFPKITEQDIAAFEQKYRFSEEERKDVVEAYEKVDGKLSDLMDSIMLSTEDDEDRFVEMVEKAIAAKEVKALPAWRTTMKQRQEQQKKPVAAALKEKNKQKRAAKHAKEAKEADELMSAIRGGSHALTKAKRGRDFSSLISSIEAKYSESENSSKRQRGKKAKAPAEWSEPSEEEFLATQKRLMKNKKK